VIIFSWFLWHFLCSNKFVKLSRCDKNADRKRVRVLVCILDHGRIDRIDTPNIFRSPLMWKRLEIHGIVTFWWWIGRLIGLQRVLEIRIRWLYRTSRARDRKRSQYQGHESISRLSVGFSSRISLRRIVDTPVSGLTFSERLLIKNGESGVQPDFHIR